MVSRYNIDLACSYMVGDTTMDIQTGVNAGVKTILVHTGEAGRDGKFEVKADYEAKDLMEAVRIVVGNEG
jgi:phosphoglycolate phosphatase-like HAD superfamily hydrolase